VVASAVAPHDEVEVAVKFVPLMVSVKAAPPATAMAGLRLVMEGGGLTENAKAGLEARTKVVVSESEDKFEFVDGRGADVGAAVRSEALGEGVVPLMGVARTAPPVEPVAGVALVTVVGGADGWMVCATPGATAEAGLGRRIAAGGGLMVKVMQEEASPSVLTVTQIASVLAARLAGTDAVSSVSLS
jgi:hypothetical protein